MNKPHVRPDLRVRNAILEDVSAIEELLAEPARNGIILPRPRKDIEQAIDTFQVVCEGDEVIGCVALKNYYEGLFEIRSLAVSTTYRGKGVGSELVAAAEKAATHRGAQRIFALTLTPGLFEKLGFERVSMEKFPEKVWDDCMYCPKRENCDEIALLKTIRRTDSDNQ